MDFNFSKNTNNFLKIILKNALKQNLRVFFVGGIVRDKILNIPTLDIDLLILGNAIEFSKSLPSKIKIKSIHKDFCTVKLSYCDIEIDIASSRDEIYPYSGCLPEIKNVGVDLKKDVLRRDFTINSLYCELKLINDEIKYEFIDLIDGLKDIQNKTLRVLHNKSYIDDPTRIIRGLGFKYRFNFDFSKEDKILINQYLNNIDYSNTSIDRNKKVIKHILNTSFQKEIFAELVEKKYCKIINNNDLAVDFNLIDEIFEKFKLDMIFMSEFYLKILEDKEVSKFELENLAQIYKTFSKMDEIDLVYYFYKTKDDNINKFLKIKNVKLNISGADLLKLGIKQGKIIGEILDELLNEKLNNPNYFKNKKLELDWVLKKFPQKSNL